MRSGMAGKKDCSYPNCSECQYEDCIVDNVREDAIMRILKLIGRSRGIIEAG